jgi:hypothetical protein
MDCGYGHYVRLMKHFDTVLDVFLGLEPGFQVGPEATGLERGPPAGRDGAWPQPRSLSQSGCRAERLSALQLRISK